MSMYKNDRTAEDIKREITAVIRELKDPRVQGKLLTVVRIELASDLSFGKVYISALEGIETAKTAVKGLENANGMIRRELLHRLKLRKSPELKFVADDSVEKGIELWTNYENKLRKDKSNEDN
ncbi:MAG: 30S ribosome-binding factor RbfA [Clostridia bacterium]|nr:30S ribosome-binding factor RbfA [Clostridia bacterium]